MVHTSPLAASHYEHAGLLQSAFIDLQTVFILHSLPNETRRELHPSILTAYPRRVAEAWRLSELTGCALSFG